MKRRTFLGRSTALAASSFVGTAAFDLLAQPARADGCSGPAPAVQLYTVRDALGRDPRAALRQLREIGIVEAELYGLNGPESATLFGLPARELKRAFDENGNPAGGGDRVKGEQTFDLNLAYEGEAGFLEGHRVYLNIKNVFDSEPVYYNGNTSGIGVGAWGFNGFVSNPIGRVVSVGFSAQF